MKRSFAQVLSDFTQDQPFRRQRSRKVKNGTFERDSFFSISSVLEMIEYLFDTIVFASSRRIETCIAWPWKVQGQNLTSGQGHVLTQVGHIAYESMRLDERNTMRPFSRLYLFWIKSYLQKTVGELRWPQMTFWGSPMKTVAWVIADDLSRHHSEWMEMFRCGEEVVDILPIALPWAVGCVASHSSRCSYDFPLLRDSKGPVV